METVQQSAMRNHAGASPMSAGIPALRPAPAFGKRRARQRPRGQPRPPVKVSTFALFLRVLYVASRVLGVLLRLWIESITYHKPDKGRRRARHWRMFLEELGGIYVKVGQFMSVRTDVLSWELCEELSHLLDSTRPFPAEQAIAVIESEMGAPIEEIFSYFDPMPIAAASMAQVHVARLREDDAKVAIKVLRPGIDLKISMDVQVLLWLAKLADALNPRSGAEQLPLMREFQRAMEEETSLLGEARACMEFRKTLERRKQLRAPRVHVEYSTDRVLIMEFIDGIPLSVLIKAIEGNDTVVLQRLEEMGVDRAVLAKRLYQAFLRQALEHNIAHGDPHPGNILILPKNRLCFVDFGAVAYYGPSFRMKQERIFQAAAREDVDELVRAILSSWEPLPPRDIEVVKREIKPIYLRMLVNSRSKHGDPRWKSSGRAFTEISKLAAQWGLNPPSEMLRYNRMLLEIDAIVVTLDPDFNVVKVMRRYFIERERRKLQAMMSSETLQRTMAAAMRIATELPGDIQELRYQMYAAFHRSSHLYTSVLSKASSVIGMLVNQVQILVRLGVLGLIVARLAMGVEPVEAALAEHLRLSVPWWTWLLAGLYLSNLLGRTRYIASEVHHS